jgi:hypothetical protein
MEGKLRRKSKSVCYLDESTHAKTAETRQSTQLQTRPRIKYRLRQLECQSTGGWEKLADSYLSHQEGRRPCARESGVAS